MSGPRPWCCERCPPLLSPRKRRLWAEGGSEGTMMLRFLRRTFGRRSMQRHAGRGGIRAGRDERDGGAVGMRAAGPVTSPPGGFYPHPNYHSPPVLSGGATVHIPAAGDSKSVLTCKVQLLDGTDVSVDLPVRPSATSTGHFFCTGLDVTWGVGSSGAWQVLAAMDGQSLAQRW